MWKRQLSAEEEPAGCSHFLHRDVPGLRLVFLSRSVVPKNKESIYVCRAEPQNSHCLLFPAPLRERRRTSTHTLSSVTPVLLFCIPRVLFMEELQRALSVLVEDGYTSLMLGILEALLA